MGSPGASSPTRAADALELLELLRQRGADFERRDYKDRTVQDCLKYFGTVTEPGLSPHTP